MNFIINPLAASTHYDGFALQELSINLSRQNYDLASIQRNTKML